MPESTVFPDKLTPRQIERRKRIMEVAQQMLGERGYDGVSMRAIAAASNVAEKTLYNIFGSKDRLIAMTAQQRSANVFEAAVKAAPEGGFALLKVFARTATDITIAEPEMARALADVLVDHSELVGLNQVYDVHVVRALEQMQASGLIEARASWLATTRLVRLGIVAAVVFWAKGQLSDAELEHYMLLRICETLLPLARDGAGDAIGKGARAAAAALD